MERAIERRTGLPGLGEYLLEYRGLGGLLFVFAVIFASVFYGYHAPLEAVLYGTLLCLCAGGLLLAWRYRGFCRKMDALAQMEEAFLRDPDRYYVEQFPNAKSLWEREYQRFLTLISRDRERIRGQAEAAREEMTDYYTLWVHQIKTPIAAMGLLLRKQDSASCRELEDQLFKIEEYVNMVLQYLRLDGGSDLVVQWHDLDMIVRQAVRRYAGMFIRKHLSLTYEPLNRRVLTDEKWLVFVVEQILSNAVKYTGQGGGITICLGEGPKPVLIIRDTGIGIAAEDQPRIFEKGFTGYNGHSDKRSTGIGLYLCRRVLKHLSHGIDVESEPGKGTAIRISLGSDSLPVE